MAAVPVILFNGGAQTLSVMVNGASPLSIPPASAPGWIPQSPASGGPTWASKPDRNVMGPGNNQILVKLASGGLTFAAEMALPTTTTWTSVQVFLFMQDDNSLTWLVLNGADYVTGRLESPPYP